MRSKRRRRRRRSRRAGQNNPLEKAWDGKGYSNTTHPKAFARDLPIKLGPLARRRGMNNDNRVALTLNPRSRRNKDLSNLAYYNTTRKGRKARGAKAEVARKKEQIKKFVRTFRAQRKRGRSGGRRRRRSRRRRKRGGAGKCWKCGKDVTAEQQCPSCGARWPGSSKGGDVGGGWFQKWSNKENRAYYYHERDPKTPYWEKPQQDAGGGAGGAAASNAYSDVEWSDDGSRPSNIQGTAAQYRRSPKYTSVADGPKGREDRKKPDKYDPNKGGRRRRSRRRRRQSGGAPTCKKCGSDLQCPRCDGGGGNGGSGAAANESRIKENEARIKENEAYIKKKDKEIEDLIAGSAAELEDF